MVRDFGYDLCQPKAKSIMLVTVSRHLRFYQKETWSEKTKSDIVKFYKITQDFSRI